MYIYIYNIVIVPLGRWLLLRPFGFRWPARAAGAWLNAHGWRTEGLCGCGDLDTVAHRLGGCPIRGECPVKGIRSYKDFWALLDTPPLPRKLHEDGFVVQVQDPAGEEWGLEPGEGFSDGSVKWPRWHCLAFGGMSLVQMKEDGELVRIYAAAMKLGTRRVAVRTEVLAMAVVAVQGVLLMQGAGQGVDWDQVWASVPVLRVPSLGEPVLWAPGRVETRVNAVA